MIINWTELKDARALRDWTQQELAEAVGVHQKTIVNWESKGVPPKSAYKVQRVLGDELAFVEHRAMNPSDATSFEEFRDERREQLEASEEQARSEWDSRSPEVEERAAIFQLDSEFELEKQQAAYDARVALQDTLAQFDTVTLLREVEQRVRRLQADARNQATDA